MTTLLAPICLGCKNLRDSSRASANLRCSAFPDGVPEAIITSQKDHRKAVAGDRGIRFVAASDEAKAYADLLFEAPAPRS